MSLNFSKNMGEIEIGAEQLRITGRAAESADSMTQQDFMETYGSEPGAYVIHLLRTIGLVVPMVDDRSPLPAPDQRPLLFAHTPLVPASDEAFFSVALALAEALSSVSHWSFTIEIQPAQSNLQRAAMINVRIIQKYPYYYSDDDHQRPPDDIMFVSIYQTQSAAAYGFRSTYGLPGGAFLGEFSPAIPTEAERDASAVIAARKLHDEEG